MADLRGERLLGAPRARLVMVLDRLQLGAQHLHFRLALEGLETRGDELDAVVDGLQLGCLVDDVHRGRDLAAIVQQTRDLELVAVLLRHMEVRERPRGGAVRGLGQHHGQGRHALAVSARVWALLVDRGVDELDQRLEQDLQLLDQQAVGERDRRLRGERLGEALVFLPERHDPPRGGVGGVEQLQHADDVALVVLHRHREERGRPVAGALVEVARAGEIEPFLGVGVGHVHGLVRERRVRRDHRVVRLAVAVVQRDGVERHGVAGAAAHRDGQAVGAHDLELQLVAHQPVERAAVGPRQVFRRDQDRLQQLVDVALLRERDADGVEVLELGEEMGLERAAELRGRSHRRGLQVPRVGARAGLDAPLEHLAVWLFGDDGAVRGHARRHLMQTART